MNRPASFFPGIKFSPIGSLCLMFCSVLAGAQESVTAYRFASDTASRSFRLYANGVEVPVAEIPAMTEQERLQLADSYLKMPSYCHIYDPACMHLHAAHLATNGKVQIEIRAEEEIKEYRIHPLQWQIRAKAEGRILHFVSEKRHQPRYYVIRINQLPPLRSEERRVGKEC